MNTTRDRPVSIAKLAVRVAVENTLAPGDGHWNTVLDGRFASHVSIHSHIQIAKARRIPTERILPPRERMARMERYGFQFKEFLSLVTLWDFRAVLKAAGISQGLLSTDPVQELNDPEKYADLVNVLNGGAAELDYEGLLPHLHGLFQMVKRHKFHLEGEALNSEGRSPLSVPDILLCICLNHVTNGWSSAYRERYFLLVGRSIDTRVPNEQRLQDLQKMRELEVAESSHVASGVPALLGYIKAANDQLSAMCGGYDMKERPDAIIPLHGGDCSGAGYFSRAILQHHPDAFLVPIGGHAPHQTKTLGREDAGYSESDEIVAAACVTEFRHRYGLLGAQDLPRFPALRVEDILFSGDHVSNDTQSNVQKAAPVIRSLQEELKRQVHVLIISTNHHAARARAEFLSLGNLLGEEKVRISSLEVPQVGAMADVRYARPVGLGNLFGEYLKRLYMVSVG